MVIRSAPSRCCTPGPDPLRWHRFQEQDGTAVVDDELSAAFPPSLPHAVRKARYASYMSLIELAAKGGLDVEDDRFDPVSRDPTLWELRWVFEDGSLWRQYHAEPASAPGYLVAMLFHQKAIGGSNNETRAAQDARIDAASKHYVYGHTWKWGIP